jgi:hypothetical protein
MISMQTNTTPVTSTQAIPNVWTRGSWAARITDAWQKQIPSIFEVGSLLESAKAELRHGDWAKMIKADLPFSQSAANKLMKIAACDHLRNSDHGPNLPACWRTLYELTALSAEQFEHGITIGAINPKMQRKDIRTLRGVPASATESKPSAISIVKRRVAEQDIEIAQLRARLANVQDGSLFDLKKDTPKDIGSVWADTITETRAIAIMEAIKAAFKAKRQAR